MIDNIFGEVNYDVMWEVTKNVKLFDEIYKVLFLIHDYDEKGINNSQRESYLKYKGLENKISNNLYMLISEYINKNINIYIEYNNSAKKIESIHDLNNVIKPVSYSFLETGEIVIEFDFIYDEENGIGTKIDMQNIDDINVGIVSDFV